MSKSLGNIINPLNLIDKYGVDSLRYFLMKEMVSVKIQPLPLIYLLRDIIQILQLMILGI